MDLFSKERSALIHALKSGTTVTSDQAARFPDIVLVPDTEQMPSWLLSLVRRHAQPDGPRYVVANGEPFHVNPSAAGTLVSKVEYFESGGTRKPVHNPYAVTSEDHQIAIAAYEMVQRFIADPQAFKDLVASGQAPKFSSSDTGMVSIGPGGTLAIRQQHSSAAATLTAIRERSPGHTVVSSQGEPSTGPAVSYKPRRRVVVAP